MPDLHYEHPRLAAIYDLDSGWSEDRDFYLALAGSGRKSVLDLGCGTGLLCNAYAAQGHEVTGADPSASMLEVAKRKPHGERIEWVECFAQDFRSAARFDLIVMTGHAFQVLLDEADILADFATMREHLAEDGLIAFETRNPAVDWKTRWDGGAFDFTWNGTAFRETRKVISYDRRRIRFETYYHFPDETLTSASELLFLSNGAIEDLLGRSGLRVEKLSGDWQGGPFDEALSDEMIFLVRRA